MFEKLWFYLEWENVVVYEILYTSIMPKKTLAHWQFPVCQWVINVAISVFAHRMFVQIVNELQEWLSTCLSLTIITSKSSLINILSALKDSLWILKVLRFFGFIYKKIKKLRRRSSLEFFCKYLLFLFCFCIIQILFKNVKSYFISINNCRQLIALFV
jgi:hypothetical protein